VFARDLVCALAAEDIEQRVVSLHASYASQLEMAAPVAMVGGPVKSAAWMESFRQGRHLSRFARTWRPDVVQAHGGAALVASVLARLDSPIVYRRIGCAPTQLRHGWRRVVYRQLVHQCRQVVAVAEAVRSDTMTLFGVPSQRITMIPNAIDPTRLVPGAERRVIRRHLGIRADAHVMLSLGSLTWEKDPLSHVRIAAAVMEQVPNVVHLIVGDGVLRTDVEAAIREKSTDAHFLMLGEHREVADFLAAADVLLFASRPDGMEGMPAVLIEGGFMSLPVAAYDVAGVREVVADGKTGFVVEWGNESGLSDVVVRLLTNADLRHTLGAAARDRCRFRFDIRTVADDYISLYQELAPTA
jgi:glycosyltransferase involved in cell wall biosynthesis